MEMLLDLVRRGRVTGTAYWQSGPNGAHYLIITHLNSKMFVPTTWENDFRA